MEKNYQSIPIIEEVSEKNGYWEIYEDGRKIWHDNIDPFKMKFQDYEKINKKYDMNSGDWLNLIEGNNKIRIVSEFEDYGTHYDKVNNKSVVCVGKENMCEFCQRGDKPRVQFLGWAIDRKDGKVKLLRVGYKIFKVLGELAQDEDYKFEELPPYDINIKRSGQGLDTTYTVLPLPKRELTEEEKEVVEKETKPTDEIIEIMKNKVLGNKNSEEKIEEISDSQENEEDINVEDLPF